jgi:pSer/pThr/pTyr-binding forkhead associated (FHA) protein
MAVIINGKLYRDVKGKEEGLYINGEKIEAITVQSFLSSIAGYDPHKIQTLKNTGEGFAWVDEE